MYKYIMKLRQFLGKRTKVQYPACYGKRITSYATMAEYDCCTCPLERDCTMKRKEMMI